MKKQINRRQMIGGMSALAVSPHLVSGQGLDIVDHKIDLSDPVQNALAYAKLVGTSDRSMIHIYYKGTIFGMTPELEEAYKGAYKGTSDLKKMVHLYGTVMGKLASDGLIPQFIEDELGNQIPNPMYITGPLVMDSKSGVTVDDLVNYLSPLLNTDSESFDRANIISAMIIHGQEIGEASSCV